MASPRIPNALQMRQLKYGRSDPAERDRVAKTLRELGRHAEALLLYEGRVDHPFVREEMKRAADHGEAFPLLLLRKMGASIAPEQFRTCAEAAERKERWLDARQAWLALGDEAAVRRIAEHLPPSLAPAPPPPEPTEEA
jgi:hypothetical protein